MPRNITNQQGTTYGLIMDILEDEAQIIHCLKEFFCKTLHDISTGHYLSPDRKVYLAKDLICAVAQKEEALAVVLEAISKIIEEEPVEWITLSPGASYQVTSPSPTVQTITFIAKTDVGVTGGEISALVEGTEIDLTGINDIPMQYTINLGYQFNPNLVTLQNTGNVTVYIRNVTAS